MSDIEPPLEIVHGADPAAAVIWLHGLGANGYDFQPVVPQLRLPDELSVRFVFPHAPDRPVTVNGGMVMPAWYDIYALQEGARADLQGLTESADLVRDLVQKEVDRGVPGQRIVLAGFSQGGAVVLHTLTHYPSVFAGVLALSTYLPADAADQAVLEYNRGIPVFMAHGTQDTVVPYRWGRQSAGKLQQFGFNVEWREYAMPHSVSVEEIQDIGLWLRRVLSR